MSLHAASIHAHKSLVVAVTKCGEPVVRQSYHALVQWETKLVIMQASEEALHMWLEESAGCFMPHEVECCPVDRLHHGLFVDRVSPQSPKLL